MLEADVCVIGSGAGGGLIAGVLAQAGLDVVVLEAGGNFNEPDFTGLELPAFQQLFWRGGPTPSADFNVSLLAGSTLGGGPTVNWSNCLRTPAHVREQWASEFGLEGVEAPTSTVISMLSGRGWASTNAARTSTGRTSACATAPRRSAGRSRSSAATRIPAAYSPDTAGYIGMGDRSGAKLDVRRTYLRDACQAGARVIVRCRAERVLTEDGRAAGVQARVADPQTGASTSITVRAPRVVVACGSLESPALLLRSGIGGPAVGSICTCTRWSRSSDCTPRPQRPWWGGPMTAMVDEFADIEGGYGFLLQGCSGRIRSSPAPRPTRRARSSRRRWRGWRTPPGSSGWIAIAATAA